MGTTLSAMRCSSLQHAHQMHWFSMDTVHPIGTWCPMNRKRSRDINAGGPHCVGHKVTVLYRVEKLR